MEGRERTREERSEGSLGEEAHLRPCIPSPMALNRAKGWLWAGGHRLDMQSHDCLVRDTMSPSIVRPLDILQDEPKECSDPVLLQDGGDPQALGTSVRTACSALG